jgi:hypothetical protein
MLLYALSLAQFTQLTLLIIHLCHQIIWSQSVHAQEASLNLPANVNKFLSTALGIGEDQLEHCWKGLQGIMWEAIVSESDTNQLCNNEHVSTFCQIGVPLGIGAFLFRGCTALSLLTSDFTGFYDMYQLASVSFDPQCVGQQCSTGHMVRKELSDITSHKVTLFLRDLGPMVSWPFSGHCTHESPVYHIGFTFPLS